MEPTIIGRFKKEEDAMDAINELKVLGVDKVETRKEGEDTIVEAKFSEVTGIRNVFEKRNAFEISESMPNRS
jgi:hypothetical protein